MATESTVFHKFFVEFNSPSNEMPWCHLVQSQCEDSNQIE